MPYREEILLKRKSEWEKIVKEAAIYELNVPDSIDSLPVGQEKEWNREMDGGIRSSQEKAVISEVIEVWTNPKNSVKVIVVGKDKKIAIFSRNHVIEGWISINMPDRYDENQSFDFFDNLHKGSFIVIRGERYWNSENWEIGFISNAQTIDEVSLILDTLYEMNETRTKWNEFRWDFEDRVESYGTVSLNEVLHQKLIFEKTLRKFKWNKRKERWDLWNSVKANLSINKTKTLIKVTVKSPFDGNTYFCELPIVDKEEEKIGWDEGSLYTMDYWLPFIYRKSGDNFMNQTLQYKMEDLAQRLIKVFKKLPRQDFTLGIGKHRVKVERKEASNGAKLNYLNGNLIAEIDCEDKLKEYFLSGKPINPTPAPTIQGQPKIKVLSVEAKKLRDEGLNGIMKDLEGDFPFHLNILYKEDEHKWYIEMAGKEFYVKGGQTALKKIDSAIRGTAMVNHSKYGYSRYGTMMIKDRIAELVGDENALWIVLQVKRMGAMMKAISNEGES